jgi:hypothetical protein
MTQHFKGRSEPISSSKSTNKQVLCVYNEILKHAYSDSDYWYLGGDGEILDMLYDFDNSDLSELKNDIGNWALNEALIFRRALENDYSASHDDLLPVRSYLYGYTMTLANRYLTTDKRIAALFIDNLEIEFLAEGHLKDKVLLAEIKKTLANVEASPGIVGDPVRDYIRQARFDHIKETIQKLYNEAD